MASRPGTGPASGRLSRAPSNAVAYAAVLAALVSAVVHLFLALSVVGIGRTIGLLFLLNGLGWVGGVLLSFTRVWRRELHLVAVGYALATIVAFVAFDGPLNTLAIVSKVAEAAVALAAAYLYAVEGPR